MYCRVGSIRPGYYIEHKAWQADIDLFEGLPRAKKYWFVFRFERPGIPPNDAVPAVAEAVQRLTEMAAARKWPMAGIQLDIDCPTRRLNQYASFLRELRKRTPKEVKLSITALLDWFRGGTAIDQVIEQVDEFVPQFYDLQDRDRYGESAIAGAVSAADWRGRFNRFERPYRIGISTFGRARLVPESRYIPDIKPLDIARRPDFRIQVSRTKTHEILLRYVVERSTRLAWMQLEPGNAIEFILPTPDAVRASVEQAKAFGGYCAGVLFFRWPQVNEALTMRPEDVLLSAGAIARRRTPQDQLRTVDEGCASVHCTDLYLINARPLSPGPVRYRITSANDLEYFIPGETVPARMAGPAEIELVLPPYCGQPRMHLGRAVTAKSTEFRMEVDH